VFTAQSIARPVQALDLEGADIASAIRYMDDLDLDAMHVVKDDKFVGLVTYRAASAALRNGGALTDVVSSDFPTAAPQTRLHDLYGLAEKGLPIAVTEGGEGSGRPTGIVLPGAVFAQLAEGRA
jgi:glycine betaine/proline transport system ATP-binding protein